MKVNSTVNALLLLVGVSCAGVASSSTTPTLGDCKAFCKETRQGMLADIGTCKPALKQPPVPKLFNACVEGRKKAFDQACIPICIKAEMSVSSFEGCKVIAKKNGQKYENWCRKVSFYNTGCCDQLRYAATMKTLSLSFFCLFLKQ